jgi:gas vesicle protein
MGTFLLGFGIGVLGGILGAPYAGKQSRELLGTKAGEGLNYLKDRTEGLRGTASDAVERTKEAVSQQLENLASNTNAHTLYQR